MSGTTPTSRALPRRTVGWRSPRPRTRRRDGLAAGLFILPSLLPLIAFVVWPMMMSAWVSVHRWNLLTPMTWVGLDNYRTLLTSADTWAAFAHTGYFVLGYLPLVYAGGLILALALNRAIRGRNLFRTVYFVPVVTSWVVVALTWRWLLNPANGPINAVLGALHLPQPQWWADPTWAMPSIILASAWKDLGYVTILLLAGLQAIPQEYREAAKVDGANAWQTFWRVIFPLLTPATFFVVVISLINGSQVFDQVYVMTGGGPSGATEVVVQQIYNLTFRYNRAGQASALSWLLFLVVLAITIGQVRAQRRWVHYG